MEIGMFKVLSILVILFAVPAGLSKADTNADPSNLAKWELVKEADQVKVYQKNEAGSALFSLRGETVLHSSLDQITKVLGDSSIAGEWIPKVERRVLLKEFTQKDRVEVTYVNMPWPITDRYFVNRAKLEILPDGTYLISIKAHTEDLVKNEDMVMGQLHFSKFVLKPLPDGSTHFLLEVNTDPKGMIPKWIVNYAQRSWPIDFFNGLRRVLSSQQQLTSEPLVH
jgi:hypothetical protein